jgi:hypothetical protein
MYLAYQDMACFIFDAHYFGWSIPVDSSQQSRSLV